MSTNGVTALLADEVHVRRQSGPRWGRVPDWILTSGLSPLAKVAYCVLDAGLGASTTREDLSSVIGCSEKQIGSAFRELLAVGALARQEGSAGVGYVLRWTAPA